LIDVCSRLDFCAPYIPRRGTLIHRFPLRGNRLGGGARIADSGRMEKNSVSIVPIAEVENLVAKYGDKTVLENITMRVAPSEIRVILGTSGCGKTTLLKTMIGLLRPAAGTVRLFGREMIEPDTPDAAKLLRMVGVLFQNGALLGSLTVGDNVRLPLQMHTRLPAAVIDEIVMLKLSQVELPQAIDLYPRELSGGMRKRAALARALALDPPLLFCDEPSAGLDPVTSAGLDKLLLKLRQSLGITIVVVTHELMSIDAIADNILYLRDGRSLFDGPHSQARLIQEGPLFDFFHRSEPAAQMDVGASEQLYDVER
jgi:phospholipid/cholesterol/gamma-HCH transport system ATP-binding protein